MVFSISSFLRSSPPQSAAPAKQQPVRALPGSWYTSQDLYELERRAIFQRKWILITHKMRLADPGDWLHYEVANFDFVLYNDDGEVAGVRDTKTIDQTSGCPSIHIHIDYNDFVWINLDEKAVPEIAWDDDFAGADKQARYNNANFYDYVFDHTWEMQGDYNWKILADNYNECYHCTTTHPDLVGLTNLEAYDVKPINNYLEHYVATKPEQAARGLTVHPTYFFPTTSMNISRDFFMMQRFVPHGPTKSTMRYEVYRHKNALDADFTEINEIYKRVMGEDKVLCEYTQRNINGGVFVNGEMHPRLEKGPLWFQQLCRETVTDYQEREQAQQSWAVWQALLGSPKRLSMEYKQELQTVQAPQVAAY